MQQHLTFNQIISLMGLIISALGMAGTILGVYIKSRTQWNTIKITQARMQIDINKLIKESEIKIKEHQENCKSKFTDIEKIADRDRNNFNEFTKLNREEHTLMFNKIDEIKDILITRFNNFK